MDSDEILEKARLFISKLVLLVFCLLSRNVTGQSALRQAQDRHDCPSLFLECSEYSGMTKKWLIKGILLLCIIRL